MGADAARAGLVAELMRQVAELDALVEKVQGQRTACCARLLELGELPPGGDPTPPAARSPSPVAVQVLTLPAVLRRSARHGAAPAPELVRLAAEHAAQQASAGTPDARA